MTSKNILSFFNALIIHYRKVDLKYKDIPYYKEEDIVKLFMEYQSIEKVFESIVLKFEKDVVVDDEYIDGVFKEFKIDKEEANKVLRQMSQPKEPSFSRQALMKKPSFSKKNLSDTDESKLSSIQTNPEELKSNDDAVDDTLNIISFLIPLVGLIYYASNNDTKPIKSAAAGKSAIIGAVVEIIIWFLYYRWLMSEIKSITSF